MTVGPFTLDPRDAEVAVVINGFAENRSTRRGVALDWACVTVADTTKALTPANSATKRRNREAGRDMVRRYPWSVATATWLAAWCASANLVGLDAQVAPAETVRAREVAFAASMANRDFQAFLTFIAPDAVFFNGNEPIRGQDAIGEAWRPFFDGPTAPFSWSPDVVEVLESGGLAMTSGPVRDPAGTPSGRFNSVWRRDADGVWRVVFDKGS